MMKKILLIVGIVLFSSVLFAQQSGPSISWDKKVHDFEKFQEDDIPFNSDVVLIVSQYIKCLEKYKFDNISEVIVIFSAENVMVTSELPCRNVIKLLYHTQILLQSLI